MLEQGAGHYDTVYVHVIFKCLWKTVLGLPRQFHYHKDIWVTMPALYAKHYGALSSVEVYLGG